VVLIGEGEGEDRRSGRRREEEKGEKRWGRRSMRRNEVNNGDRSLLNIIASSRG
jgi:hypothetical protein